MDIGVVIVTFNRADKLRHALQSFEEQSKLPQYVIVVNNASTDSTQDILADWRSVPASYIKKVIQMPENIGGSGGFYEGLKAALDMEADWIWVSDDDAFPEKDALEQADDFMQKHQEELPGISVVCGQVINNGCIDLEHRRSLIVKGISIKECVPSEDKYEQEFFEINTFSYVGTIMNKQKLAEAGLTRKDYFIWFDDTEHGLRMGKQGKILCVPAVKIYHDIEKKDPAVPDWRWYYRYRNMADCYRRNFPKICFYFFYFKAIIKILLYKLLGISKTDRDMLLAGIKDARRGRFGLHGRYRPGWKGLEKKV